MRLNKFIAKNGVASRRGAEELIKQGFIRVNGKIETNLSTCVREDDVVFFKETSLTFNHQTNLWAYYKPSGLITTHNDPLNRSTVFDHLKEKHNLSNVCSVGRLDINSEGLLLLTNNGEYAGELERSKVPRVYSVRFLGNPSSKDIMKIQEGVTIEGVIYAPCQIQFTPTTSSNKWLQMTINEGKNREIRKLLQFIGCQVNRLVRLSYGPYHLEELKIDMLKKIDIDQKN